MSQGKAVAFRFGTQPKADGLETVYVKLKNKSIYRHKRLMSRDQGKAMGRACKAADNVVHLNEWIKVNPTKGAQA